MQIKVFKAGNMRDAMAAMKAELGEDAVILHSKKYKEGGLLGIGSREVVEITAAVEETSMPKRTETPRQQIPRPTVAQTLLSRYKTDGTAQAVTNAERNAENFSPERRDEPARTRPTLFTENVSRSTQADGLAEKISAQKKPAAQKALELLAQNDEDTVTLQPPRPDEQPAPSSFEDLLRVAQEESVTVDLKPVEPPVKTQPVVQPQPVEKQLVTEKISSPVEKQFVTGKMPTPVESQPTKIVEPPPVKQPQPIEKVSESVTQPQPIEEVSKPVESQPVTEKISETVTQSQPIEKVLKPVETQPVTEKVSEPVTQSQPVEKISEPVMQAQPVEKISEPVMQPQPVEKVSEPVTQSQPIEKVSEPVTQPPASEPIEKISTPVAQPQPIEKIPEPVTQPQPQPQPSPQQQGLSPEQLAQTQAMIVAQFNQMQMMQQAALAQAQAQAQAQAAENLRLQQQAAQAQQATQVQPPPDPQNEEKIKRLEDEIAHMKALLAEVLGREPKKGNISLHEAMKLQEVDEEILAEMATQANAGDTLVDIHAPTAKATLINYLNEHIKFSDGVKLNRHGVRIAALLGTTGVGKTTTLAKIAAKFVLEQKTNVALITADTYRISAVEQLKTYSDILELPLEIVYSPAELASAIERHRDKDLILIDTAGRSQHNEYQMRELEEFLRVNSRIEKHLVISATTKYTDARQIMNKFSQVDPDRIIFTKIDETGSLGMIVNLLRDNKYSLSYITTGQSVPDDIERAGAEILATLLLKKVEE